MINKPNTIIWHHSADPGTGHQADKINASHRVRGFTLSKLGFYGGYHILIEKDGTVVRFRNDNEIGCHTFNFNKNTLGICLAGNFETETPLPNQQIAFHRQLKQWLELYNIKLENIKPHRFYRATACPGKKLYDTWAQEILNDPLPEENQPETILKHDSCQ